MMCFALFSSFPLCHAVSYACVLCDRYRTRSHAAELTAGYFNAGEHDGCAALFLIFLLETIGYHILLEEL